MINIIDFDEDSVMEGAIEEYESESGESLYAGDERRMIINSFVYVAKILASKANYMANQYFPQFQDEQYLTITGESKGVTRLPASYALVKVRFTVSSALPSEITVPKGTKVTADGVIYFKTVEDTVITSDEGYADISCQATVPGEIGVYEAGTIVTLVDNINYVVSVNNIEKSTNGSNIEDLESFRERILLKPNNYNTCGSIEAYKYLAKEADNSVGSVSVVTDASNVFVTILCKDGSIPNQALIDKVEDYLSEDTKRPSTDHVIVQAPTSVYYGISLSYKISSKQSSETETIKSEVNKAVNQFINNLKKLNEPVNPDELRKCVYIAGAATCVITSPEYISISESEVAVLSGEPTVLYDGLL